MSDMPEFKRSNKRKNAAILATLIAIPAEGIRQIAYYDPPGILTVCMGHTGPDVVPGKVYSLEECKALLTDDMKEAVAITDRCVPDAPLSVLTAFSDATFNLGPVIACDKANSTAARMLAAKDWSGACRQLPRWNKAKIAGVKVALAGLTTRRNLEMKVCLDGLS